MNKIAPSMLLLLAVVTSGCGRDASAYDETEASSAKPASGLPDRDPALAKRLVSEEGAVLLDVRTRAEWDDRHLEGATLIPIGELDGRLDEVKELTGGDEDKPIVVYCRSGARAGRAKQTLLEAGYTKVTNLGGIDDWPEG